MTSITRNHHKRLIIVIDGNAMLVKYWPTIISEHLEKIVRSFFYESSQEQENNSVREVGLVVYAAKANTDEGAHIKVLNWTNDMEFLLSCLPPLELIGDDSDRLVMTEALMEAIMMFLKEPEYNGENHCVLVAIREPLAIITRADVPVIQDGQYCGSSEQRDVDIFDVVQMFAELNISFSVLTPAVHPIFRAIFNMGNGVEESEYGVLEGKKGEIIVLFSSTFLEAHEVLLLDALNTINPDFGVEATHDVTPRRIMYSIMELPAVETITGEETLDGHRALRLVDVPNATTILTPERDTNEEEDHYSMADMLDQFIMNNNNNEEEEEEGFDGVRPNSSAPVPVSSFEDLLNSNQETMFSGKYSGRLDDVCRQALTLRRSSSTITTTTNNNNNNEQHSNNKGKDKAILVSNDGDSSTHQAAFSSMDNNVPYVNNAPSPTMMNVLESSGGGMGVPTNNNPIFNLGSSSSNPSHHVLESSTVAGPSEAMQQVEVHDNASSGMISPGTEAMFGINNTNNSFEPTLVTTTHNHQYLPSSDYGGVTDYFSSLFPNNAELENNNSTMLHQFEQSSTSSAIVPQQQVMANDYFNNFNNAATMGGIMGYSSALVNQNHYYLDGANNNNAQFPSYYYYGDNNAIMGGNSSSSPHIMSSHEYGGSSSGYFTELLQTQQQYYAHQGFNNQQQQYQQLAGPSTFPPFHFHSSYLDSNNYAVFTWEGSIIASTYPTGGVSSYRAKAFRKKSSPIELTLLWKTKIIINNYIPQSTVEHTKSLMKLKTDFVFFHVTEYNNLDLYNLLITKKVYAKIDLPSQKLILSPTENSLCYEGIVFPGDTFFVEPPDDFY